VIEYKRACLGIVWLPIKMKIFDARYCNNNFGFDIKYRLGYELAMIS
jgi:hypothetical protein